MRVADHQAMHRDARSLQTRDHREKILVPLETRDASRQQQHGLAGQLRLGRRPCFQPCDVRHESAGKLRQLDASWNDADRLHRSLPIILRDVVADAVRHRDDPLAPRHDRRVEVDGIKSVHRRQKMRPRLHIHALQRQPRDPRGYPRARMNDVGGFLFEYPPEPPDLQE